MKLPIFGAGIWIAGQATPNPPLNPVRSAHWTPRLRRTCG